MDDDALSGTEDFCLGRLLSRQHCLKIQAPLILAHLRVVVIDFERRDEAVANKKRTKSMGRNIEAINKEPT